MKKDNLKDQYRINEKIRTREVRLVGDNVEQGVYPIVEAIKIAEELNLDLIEISPNAVPPVCRILDYQKFIYQQKKRQKEQEKSEISVRKQGEGDVGSMKIINFAELLNKEVEKQMNQW